MSSININTLRSKYGLRVEKISTGEIFGRNESLALLHESIWTDVPFTDNIPTWLPEGGFPVPFFQSVEIVNGVPVFNFVVNPEYTAAVEENNQKLGLYEDNLKAVYGDYHLVLMAGNYWKGWFKCNDDGNGELNSTRWSAFVKKTILWKDKETILRSLVRA